MRSFVFTIFALSATAQIFPDTDETKFCSWLWQGSVIDGDSLYIAGGEVYFLNTTSNEAIMDTNHGVHIIDLSSNWTTSSVPCTTISNSPDQNLRVHRPTFFKDPVAKSMNVYGGWPYTIMSDFVPYVSAWPLNSGPNFEEINMARFGLNGSSSFPYTRKGGALVTQSDAAYFSLGGFGTAGTDPAFNELDPSLQFPESGMLEYDFQGEKFSNASTTFHRALGEAQYLSGFGEEGIIVYIGGDKPTSENYVVSSSLVDMSDITVYDIKTGNFYDQTTTGSIIPAGRSGFCSVAVRGTNSSSYEIYIFGGMPGPTTTALEADMGIVYILSLPAFQWIKTAATQPWRYSNTCQLVGVATSPSQMLNIGGIGIGGISDQLTIADTFPSGLAVFNLNTLTWQDSYDPNAPAYVPDVSIGALYDAAGRPKTKVPFVDAALVSIFNVTTAASSSSPTSSAGTSSTGSATGSKSSKSTLTGAIVGGSVGGVVVISSLCILGLFLLKRRKRSDVATELFVEPPKAVAGPVENTDSEIGNKSHPEGLDRMHEAPGNDVMYINRDVPRWA